MAGGRPTDYTKELGDELCSLIAAGSNFNRITKLDQYPSHETLYRWLRIHSEFRDNYNMAIKERGHTRFDKLDDVIKDMREKAIDPAMARVELDAIKWQCGREDPKKYGDRTAHEIANAPGESFKTEASLSEEDRAIIQRCIQNELKRSQDESK